MTRRITNMSRAAALLMTTLHVFSARFEAQKKDKGAAAVEYGLLVGLIAVAIILTVGLLGDELNRLFDDVLSELELAVV
ncbi:Flp family type IVb pilin [Antribacter sp. KLBMP9083]|uniref:Flp family type IVb pilin n=1 Tax=Antribacter soli TaxID=2910976 RepID=A0AA41QG32_9MICO|nr:Flp family type IVb pilin [Antribacter soli]MCF4122815.1 Flp family type IVb pilin [Antribacter soli]